MADTTTIPLAPHPAWCDRDCKKVHSWFSPLVWLAAHPEVGLRVERVRDGWLGYYDAIRHEIVVDENLTPDELYDTLAHEVVHAIRRDRGDEHGDCGNEEAVDALAQAMFGPYRCAHCTAAKEAS